MMKMFDVTVIIFNVFFLCVKYFVKCGWAYRLRPGYDLVRLLGGLVRAEGEGAESDPADYIAPM